jgi:hypothetical protein
LKEYQGNDQQREATLKGLFGEAGCDDQHLSEQPVSDRTYRTPSVFFRERPINHNRRSAFRSRV